MDIEYYLMHKDIPVCLMQISDEGLLGNVRRNEDALAHFPLGRHMNNIAVMRDPDTLELRGFAPIFDSGNSMFYNIPYEDLSYIRLDDIKTHSFIAKESRLLQYVRNRGLVDIEKTGMDFSIYEQDVTERHMRIPKLQELYERKIERLSVFQRGADIWKDRRK